MSRDTKTNQRVPPGSISRQYVAVNLAGDTTFTEQQPVGFYVGGAGNLKLDDCFGNAVTFMAVPVGTFLPISATKVYASGTTASNVVAMF